MRKLARVAALTVEVAVGLGGSVTAAWADDAGPALRVSEQDLARSLVCDGDPAGSEQAPVLLIPGTTLTPREFSWNYAPAFRAQGRPFCTVELPGNAMGDIPTAAEYVVSAIRTMSDRADRPVDVVGHSQGGMITRWALKFWPDTRSDVDDVVGLAPSNHGTIVTGPVCVPGCAPAIRQPAADSRFIAALNEGGETYDSVDYTVAYTELDEVVFPNLGPLPVLPDAAPPPSSPLRDGGDNVANVSLQSVCPAHPADHLTTGTSDPVVYALVVDALDHDGPADPSRIDRSVCGQLLAPGVDPLTFPADFAELGVTVAGALATYPRVSAEPALPDYVT